MIYTQEHQEPVETMPYRQDDQHPPKDDKTPVPGTDKYPKDN